MKVDDQKIIYLDNAAGTKMDDDIREKMSEIEQEFYGNPSSQHELGRRSHSLLNQARKVSASAINADPEEIIFTGSGTESDNLALWGIAHAYKEFGKHIIVSAIEHKAVLEMCHHLESEGFEVRYLDVDHDGLVNIDDLERSIREDTILVSIMYANNEIGTIQDIPKISQVIETAKKDKTFPLLHSDACQAAGALDLDVEKLGVDLLTLNGSKIYGPKGTGCLYVKSGVKMQGHILGGNQEKRLRAGTENVVLWYGFALALEKVCSNRADSDSRLVDLRDYFINGVLTTISESFLNGHVLKRLPNNINICIPQVEGEALLHLLDIDRICCSTGSACSANDLTPSHVLRAIGVSQDHIHGSLRFSLGKDTTKADLDYTLTSLERSVSRLRSITSIPAHV